MSDLIDVKKIRQILGMTQIDLAKYVGVDEKTVRNWEKGGNVALVKKKILRVLAKRAAMMEKAGYEPYTLDDIGETDGTPLYDVVATCGYLENLSEGNPIGKISVPNMPRCDGAIYVTGDSMAPVLSSGDIVAYKVIHDLDMISYGEIYIVQYEKGDDRTICVKYVKKSDDDKKLKLVSYNKDYDTIDINKKNVTYLAKVLFSIRQMAII